MIISGIGSVFGVVSEYLIFLCIFSFAYSTIICWYYYGSFAFEYLFGKRISYIFCISFFFAVFIGAFSPCERFVGASDAVLLLLSLISLLALLKNSDRICLLSEKGGIARFKR